MPENTVSKKTKNTTNRKGKGYQNQKESMGGGSKGVPSTTVKRIVVLKASQRNF